MDAIYQWIEGRFRALASFVFRHPWAHLALVLLIALALSSQLPRLTLDVSNEGFFRPDSEIVLNYNDFREQFGREDVLYISIAPEEIFEESFLRSLQEFHAALEARVPHVDEVTSLLNARNTRGEGDELIVEDLFEQWPQNAAEMATLKARALANPVYRNLLLSADGRVTAVAVRASPWPVSDVGEDALDGFDFEAVEVDTETAGQAFLDGEQAAAFVREAQAVVREYHSEEFPLALSGMPAVTEMVKAYMRRDLGRFVIGSLLVSIVLLSLLFRRLSGVVLPVLVIFLTLFSTLGLMALTGTAFKVQTQVLPSFLMAVSIAAAVHILSQFYRHYDETGDRHRSLVDAMGHSGAPVLGAGLTTGVGMMSFSNSAMAPLADLGMFSGLGILLSILYTLILIPALLAVLPLRARPVSSGQLISRLLSATAEFTLRYSRPIIAACLIGTLVSCWGISKLVFHHDVLAWFPEGTPVREDTYRIDEQMKGVQSFEIVIDTGVENGLYDPALLKSMESLAEALLSMESAGLASSKTLSVVDVVKEINQALNGGDPDFYRLPEDRRLIAQELLLFENSGSDDLEDYVDSQFSRARLMVKLPWGEATSLERYLQALTALAAAHLPPDVDMNVTGVSTLYGHVVHLSKASMMESYLLAGVVISMLIVLFIGDLKLGLLAMIPNFSPIIVTLGVMGLMGIPLSLFTMFVGSIALGLAVDDTLHFFHGFKRYLQRSGDTEQAIRMTFQSTGRALMVTTAALAAGFFVFGMAAMEAVRYFGLLTGLTILLALFGDFVLTPAIFKEVVRKRAGAPDAEVSEGVVK